MILVTACPKAGSHAFAAFLDRVGAKRCPGTLLGCTSEQALHVAGTKAITLTVLPLLPDNSYMLAHVCAAHAASLDGIPKVCVLRDPRNVLISYQRHRKRVDGIDVSTAETLIDFWGAPFLDVYRGFLGWQGHAAIVRYEDLPALVVGDGSGIYCRHDAMHNTRTGSPSDWTETWDCADHHAWRAAGGPALAAEAGYG